MSVVKGVVLGLLRERPGYPYELVRRFERRIGSAWIVNDGQFYLAIADLEKRGLIEPAPCEPSSSDVGSRRRIMRLTSRGHDELERWFERPVREDFRRMRSELGAKLLLADVEHFRIVLENFERYEQCRIAEARELASSRAPLLDDMDWQTTLVELLREVGLSARITDLKWLRVARRMLARLASDEPHSQYDLHDALPSQMLAVLRASHDEILGVEQGSSSPG